MKNRISWYGVRIWITFVWVMVMGKQRVDTGGHYNTEEGRRVIRI